MQNQRKESRKKLIAFTLVYDLLHKKLIGYVGDLTPQGVMVIGETALEVGRRLAIGIEFPNEELNEKPQRVVVSSRVAWCVFVMVVRWVNLLFRTILAVRLMWYNKLP